MLTKNSIYFIVTNDHKMEFFFIEKSNRLTFHLESMRIMISEDYELQKNFLKILPFYNAPVNLIELWIKTYKLIANKFNDNKIKNLQNFLKLLRFNDNINFTKEYKKKILEELGNIQEIYQILKMKVIKQIITNDKLQKSKKDCPEVKDIDILDISDKKIVNELTQRCSLKLIDISIKDFFSKEKGKGYEFMISIFTKISLLVPTEIIRRSNKDEQIKLVKKFINIAYKLKEIANFHIMTAFIVGLASPAIQRIDFLKYIFKTSDKFKELSNFIDPLSNYKKYRDILMKVTGPCIPLMSIISSDVIHLSEQPFYINEIGCFNMNIYPHCLRIANELEKYKENPYNLVRNDLVNTYFNKYKIWNDDKLFKTSIRLYPNLDQSSESKSDDKSRSSSISDKIEIEIEKREAEDKQPTNNNYDDKIIETIKELPDKPVFSYINNIKSFNELKKLKKDDILEFGKSKSYSPTTISELEKEFNFKPKDDININQKRTLDRTKRHQRKKSSDKSSRDLQRVDTQLEFNKSKSYNPNLGDFHPINSNSKTEKSERRQISTFKRAKSFDKKHD